MIRDKHQEKITMFRSMLIGAASFAVTAVMIVGTSAHGFTLI